VENILYAFDGRMQKLWRQIYLKLPNVKYIRMAQTKFYHIFRTKMSWMWENSSICKNWSLFSI